MSIFETFFKIKNQTIVRRVGNMDEHSQINDSAGDPKNRSKKASGN